LTLDESEAQGVTILNNTVTAQVAAGNDLVIKGASQSATISGMTMPALAAEHIPSSDVSFVLTGDPNLPNGGLFERLDGLTIPSLGITFNGATPADLYPTTIYTQEYDGFADVCRYPIDFLCDINSVLGIEYVHGTYMNFTPAQIDSGFLLPGSQALGADTLTNYYMIPTADLPLLDPVRDIPIIGNPIADLLQPDLTYLVNLGYGDPLYGWSTDPANVPTPFGLFPSSSAFEQLPGLLTSGAEQGIQNFIGDFTGTGPNPVTLSSPTALLDPSSGTTTALTDPLMALSNLFKDPASLVTDFNNLVNTLSSVASTAYGTLLPTADVVNALVTTLPAYDVSLFEQGLEAGNLLDAIGQPIATDLYLFPLAAGFEVFAVAGQVSTIVSELMSL
jgi:PE-PPE domain